MVVDKHGVIRFKKNALVEYLLDNGGIDMNDLAVRGFSDEDRQQFAQLIGYSLGGYSDLGYVDKDAVGVAEKMEATGLPEDKARIMYLGGELAAVREGLREPIARLYNIHPDDLE